MHLGGVNSLFVSNSSVDKLIGIYSDTFKFYLGAGNNFTKDNTTKPDSVTVTEEVYIKK